MQVKKIISSFLVISLMTFFVAPISAENSNNDKQDLYSFLKNTDKITAKYTYPSMKIASAANGQAKLSAHTPIIIRCDETITTKDIMDGGTVNFSVLSDVKSSNGAVLITAGTPVTAIISFSSPKGMIGKSGTITISDFHTTAVDGTYVPLSSSISARPDDKMTTSIVLSVLICPLFLLMKGEDAQVSAGTTKTVYTVSDVYVKIHRL